MTIRRSLLSRMMKLQPHRPEKCSLLISEIGSNAYVSVRWKDIHGVDYVLWASGNTVKNRRGRTTTLFFSGNLHVSSDEWADSGVQTVSVQHA